MDRMTPRQREIVELTCDDDLTSDAIGYRLGIAGSSVKNHKTRVLEKFDAETMHRVCREYGEYKERRQSEDVRRALRELGAMRPEVV